MPAPSNSFENGSKQIYLYGGKQTNQNSVTHWSCASHMTHHMILAGKQLRKEQSNFLLVQMFILTAI